MLISYRLIFGHNKRSRKLFSQQSSGRSAHWILDVFRHRAAKFIESWNCSDSESYDSDPMLISLCHSSSEFVSKAASIYDDIDADNINQTYLTSDFSFLGKRLLQLQAHVMSKEPHSIRAMWNDRRSSGTWWAFWASLLRFKNFPNC